MKLRTFAESESETKVKQKPEEIYNTKPGRRINLHFLPGCIFLRGVYILRGLGVEPVPGHGPTPGPMQDGAVTVIRTKL